MEKRSFTAGLTNSENYFQRRVGGLSPLDHMAN